MSTMLGARPASARQARCRRASGSPKPLPIRSSSARQREETIGRKLAVPDLAVEAAASHDEHPRCNAGNFIEIARNEHDGASGASERVDDLENLFLGADIYA